MTKESDQLIESDLKTRVIFMLKSPLNNDFLINHTTPELLKDVYSRHYIGRKKKTVQLVENLKMENLRLCMFPLMEVECTTSEASKYAAIWRKIFAEAGYNLLEQIDVQSSEKDISDDYSVMYEQCKEQKLEDLISCEHCLFPKYKGVVCPRNYTDSAMCDLLNESQEKKNIYCRFSMDEYERIAENAKACGHTVTGYCKNILMNPWFVNGGYSEISEHTEKLKSMREDLHSLIFSIAKSRSFGPKEMGYILENMNQIEKSKREFVENFLDKFPERMESIAEKTRVVVEEEIKRQQRIKPKRRPSSK